MMDLSNLLEKSSGQLGITLSRRQLAQLLSYMDLLKEWNSRLNLTAITDDSEIVLKHFIDSFACAHQIDITGKFNAIDVGTGAGFPGIPVKIIKPEMELVLLDALKKRVEFLAQVVGTLGLDRVSTCHGRAEDVGHNDQYRGRFDFCFSRAVAQLAVLCEYCIPLLKEGGLFLAMKGPNPRHEIEQARNALAVLAAKVERVWEYRIPYTDICHSIVVIRKTAQTPEKYPRKAGKPSKRPL